MRFRILLHLGVAAAALLLFGLSSVHAGFVYTFTQSNTNSIGPDGGNYGTVTVDDHSTDVSVAAGTVRFVININPLRTGDLFASFGFNSDLSSATLSGATYTAPTNWFNHSGLPDFNKNQDGFGQFDVVVGSSASADRVSTGTITIGGLGANGTVDHFQFNSSGNAAEGNVFFAAHLDPGGTAGTGFVGTGLGDLSVIPAPSSMILAFLGMGAMGLVCARRARLASQAV